MIYPYEKYLVLSFVRGTMDVDILARLENLGYSPISPEELREKRENLRRIYPSEIFAERTKTAVKDLKAIFINHMDTLVALDIQDSGQLFMGLKDIDWDEATYINMDRKVRFSIQMLVLMGDDYAAIAKAIAKRYSYPITETSLRRYCKYFFDITRMSRKELYSYVYSCPLAKFKPMLMDAMHRNRKTTNWLAVGQNALTLEDILEEVMNEAYLKFKDNIGSTEAEKANMAMKWADVAIKTSEKYRKLLGSEENVLQQLKFKLETKTQADIPDIDGKDVV